MPQEQRSTLPWESDQLVVDTTYAERVVERLRCLNVEVGDADEDPNLGLTLLRDLTEKTTLEEYTRGKTAPDKYPKLADLDSILAELRNGFAAECGGWAPEMGKNRIADVVFPSPNPEIHVGRQYPVAEPEPIWHADPTAGEGVHVGIVDTPFVPHKSLPDVEVAGELQFKPSTPLPVRAGHSTFVAGLIQAKAPAAKITVRAGMNSTGTGTLWNAAKEIAAFAFAEEELDILNLSLGCRTADGRPPLLISRAIAKFGTKTLVVASAGNHGEIKGMVDGATRRSPVWPAALPGVVAVGAVDEDGKPAAFSPDLPWVNRHARGVDEVSSYVSEKVKLDEGEEQEFYGWARWSGTSFAAANLTGEIAAGMEPKRVT
jgi:membrane-anchored mycosin MYCP